MSSSPSSDQQNQQPGLISGHAQLAKGVIVSTLGTATNSPAWKTSGEESREAGISEMKAASENRNRNSSEQGYGKVEEIAGRVTGCEGMEKEGKRGESGKGD
ncbi:MAG: hypothetical protein M1812_007680 [Candelaria pacifica]|nr:MAG: hypothetical protein M1812_007680 [Candelaria pacifica]